MIPYPILVLLLSATTVAAGPPTIDWAECKAGEAKCIIDGMCINGYTENDILEVWATRIALVNNKCDSGFSIRPLSDTHWLLRLQIVRTNFNPTKGIQFIYDDKLLTGCVLKDGEVKLETPVQDPNAPDLSPELYPAQSSKLEAGHGFCSILFRAAASLPSKRSEYRIESGYDSTNTVEPVNKLTSASADTVLFGKEINAFIKCNPMSLKWNPGTTVDGYTKNEVPDPLSNTINCTAVKGSKLIVGNHKLGFSDATDFICDKANKKYIYMKKGVQTDFDPNQQVFCGTPIDTTCTELTSPVTRPGSTKTEFDKDPTTGKTSLKCGDGKKWFVNEKFYFSGEAKCKNGLDARLGAWFVDKNGQDVEIKSAECTARVNCTVTFNRTVPKPDGFHAVVTKNGVFNCSGGYRLKVVQPSHTRELTPSTITCDLTRGIFEMANPLEGLAKADLDGKANIYCEGESLLDAPSGASVGVVVGFGAGGFLLLALAAAFIVFFCLARRRKGKGKGRYPPKNNSDGPPISDFDDKGPGSARSSARSPRSDRENSSTDSMVERYCKPKANNQKKAVVDDKPLDADVVSALKFDPTTFTQIRFSDPWFNLKALKKYKVIRYLTRDGGRMKITKFMDLLRMLLNHETNAVTWKLVLPTVFFLERQFFHCNQTNNHNVAEKDKIIPGYCYERFRLFLLSRADNILQEKGPKPRDGDTQFEGFMRGLAWLIKYKLNIMNKEAKAEVVNTVTDIFLENRMDQEDSSRMFVWGILRHEDTGSKRTPGIHERFGHGNNQFTMFDWLFEELKEQLKKPPEKKSPVGTKIQHIMFAMGCSLDRQAMIKVWQLMKQNIRFTAEDYMYAMYGRDWLWDGAWVAMCQDPSEHQFFCERFGNTCDQYRQIADLCFSYWPDKYSLDAENGHCFEGYMLQYDRYGVKEKFVNDKYKYYDGFEADRKIYGKELNDWLIVNDWREIAGYTATDRDTLVEQAVKRQKEREEEERKEEERRKKKTPEEEKQRVEEEGKKAAAPTAPAAAQEVTATADPTTPAAAADAAANPTSPSSSTPPSGGPLAAPAPAPAAAEPPKA